MTLKNAEGQRKKI